MGRKKRKTDSSTEQGDELVAGGSDDQPGGAEAFNVNETAAVIAPTGDAAVPEGIKMIVDETTSTDTSKKLTSSSYAMTSHSGELIQEDVYVSDGSLDSDDENELEVVLTSSRVGIMRRGLHHQMMALQQPNRQWKRQDAAANIDDVTDNAATTSESREGITLSPEEAEEIKRKREEEELALLDPAQRAARLLIEKQRRELEAKIEERRRENEENVMRDPTLFSKRTAFDIRFDQIDDKPWERGVGSSDNHSEFFNYGLSEEDWLEYAAQQLIIRQELIDAYRQKRLPDSAIVPIQPQAKMEEPTTTPAETLTALTPVEEENKSADVAAISEDVSNENDATVDAVKTANEISAVHVDTVPSEGVDPKKQEIPDIAIGVGGAWGAGAAPGSFLARLIEEQDTGGAADTKSTAAPVKSETLDSQPGEGHQDYDDTDSYRGKEYVKSERDYGRSRRRGSGGEMDDASYNRDADDSSHFDNYDDPSTGRHWNRHGPPPPHSQGWLPPPPPTTSHPSHRIDSYNSYPPPPPHGNGYQGRGGRGGGRFPPRGGGRGGRGYYNRDAGSGRGDYYQEQQHSGWKRPRNDEDTRRRY